MVAMATIIVTSYEPYGVSNHRQLESFFNNLLKLTRSNKENPQVSLCLIKDFISMLYGSTERQKPQSFTLPY